MLAEQLEKLASCNIRKKPRVFSSLFKPVLGTRGQKSDGNDMQQYFACSILLVFWQVSFCFCFEVLLNGILMVIDTLHLFFDPTNISILLGTGFWFIMIKKAKFQTFAVYILMATKQNSTKQKQKNLFLKMTRSNFQAICMCRIHNYGSSGALGIDMTVIFSWETDILLLRIPHDKPFYLLHISASHVLSLQQTCQIVLSFFLQPFSLKEFATQNGRKSISFIGPQTGLFLEDHNLSEAHLMEQAHFLRI